MKIKLDTGQREPLAGRCHGGRPVDKNRKKMNDGLGQINGKRHRSHGISRITRERALKGWNTEHRGEQGLQKKNTGEMSKRTGAGKNKKWKPGGGKKGVYPFLTPNSRKSREMGDYRKGSGGGTSRQNTARPGKGNQQRGKE